MSNQGLRGLLDRFGKRSVHTEESTPLVPAEVAPLGNSVSMNDIPFPKVDLAHVTNPIPAITSAPEFVQGDAYFIHSAAAQRSLVSARSHVIINALIRNQRPSHVVEIGTYHGGTTETMVRAIVANGGGIVHTVGPFDSETFLPVLEAWSSEFREATRFYPTSSMDFYMEMDRQGIRPDLVFVDGNHDYEFALFDIMCAARRLTPGGFIIIDDTSQAGPYFAAQDFMARHPDWIDCAQRPPIPRDRTKAFDRERSHIDRTGFIILRGPLGRQLSDDRPVTFGEFAWNKPELRAIALSLDGRQGAGTLHVQCLLRGFGGGLPPSQVSATSSRAVGPGMRDLEISFAEPLTVDASHDHYRIEPWLIWIGPGPLCVERLPAAI